MKNPVNFYVFATNDVEYQIGFDYKNTITRVFEFVISWYPAKKGVFLKISDTVIDFFDKS